MALDSIGAQNFIRLDGPEIEQGSQDLLDITRPGASGRAFGKRGKGNRSVELTGVVDVDTAAAAATARANYENLRGTLVTVVRKDQSTANVTVEDVEVMDVIPGTTGIGGDTSGNFLVISRWLLSWGSVET